MRITNNVSCIKQQQPGEFKSAGDGAPPYSHVNGRKIGSTKEQENCALYISNDNLIAIEKLKEFDFPRFFDFAAGIQLTSEKSVPNQKHKSIQNNYDNTAQSQTAAKQQWLVDQWI